MTAQIIGLTGTRGVGKSTIADILVNKHGFTKIHAFAPGKAMCLTYAQQCGVDTETAFRLVYGDLRDVPHPLLPGDGLMRTIMEELGKFMGSTLGAEYTLGVEINRALRVDPNVKLVIESVVYEADFLQEIGGQVVRVIRPQAQDKIVGKHTDAAVELVKPDAYLFNNLDNMQVLELQVETTLSQLDGTVLIRGGVPKTDPKTFAIVVSGAAAEQIGEDTSMHRALLNKMHGNNNNEEHPDG